MKKYKIIVFLILILSACSSNSAIVTKIIDSGKVYKIEQQKQTIVTYKNKDVEIIVNDGVRE